MFFIVNDIYYEIISGTNNVSIIYISGTGAITIPGTVTDDNGTTYTVVNIGDAVMQSQSTDITSLIIPASVTHVGDAACQSMNLQQVVFVSNGSFTRLLTIGTGAFAVCASLTYVSLPTGQVTIGSQAFYSCSALSTVDGSSWIVSIHDQAFQSSGLTSISMSRLTSIGAEAFKDCASFSLRPLASISFQSTRFPDSLTEIGAEAFMNTPLNGYIPLPNTLTTIGRDAFANTQIERFYIYAAKYDTTTWIATSRTFNGADIFAGYNYSYNRWVLNETFYNSKVIGLPPACSSANNIPKNTKYIMSVQYYSCNSVTSIVIPNSVTYIDDSAFSSCTSLSNINLSNTLKSIGHSAFFNCSITSLVLPISVTNIGSQAFHNTLTDSSKWLKTLTLLADSGYTFGNIAFKCVTTLYVTPGFTQISAVLAGTNSVVSPFPNLRYVKSYGMNSSCNNALNINTVYNKETTPVRITYENVLPTPPTNPTLSNITTYIGNVLTSGNIPAVNNVSTSVTGSTTVSGQTVDVKTYNMTDINRNLQVQKEAYAQLFTTNSGTINTNISSVFNSIITDCRSKALTNADMSTSGSGAYSYVAKVVTLPVLSYPYPLDNLTTIADSMMYMNVNTGESIYFVDSLTTENVYYYKLTRNNDTITLEKSSDTYDVLKTVEQLSDGSFTYAATPFYTGAVPCILDFGSNRKISFDVGSIRFYNLPPEAPAGYAYETINNVVTVKNTATGSTIDTVAAANLFINVLNTLNGNSGGTGFTSCLLKGTIVQTPKGPVPIESIRVGDNVLNQVNEPVRVIEIGKGTHNVATARTLDVIYTVPTKRLGAKTPVYLTKGHRVLSKQGNLVLPEKLGLLPAHPSEYCDSEGNYTVYHLRLEDSENHLVVNGGCIVESWK